MSTFLAMPTLQLHKISACAWPAPAQDCVLCLARAPRALVCAACRDALPDLDRACARCAVPLAGRAVCGGCLAHAPGFDSAAAAFEYRFPIDRLILRFKYSGDLAIGHWLGLQLAARAAREEPPDLLVAPPLSAKRLRTRGFNQALEIAKVVAKRLALPCDLDGLARDGQADSQVGLGRRERLANLRDAFRCRLALDGRHVAIVDDVLTTGATASCIARVLKAAGARRVSVWAVARAPEPGAR
jgi:ComF family protein